MREAGFDTAEICRLREVRYPTPAPVDSRTRLHMRVLSVEPAKVEL